MKCTSITVVLLEVLLFCHLCFHFILDAYTLYFGDTVQWTMSLVGSFVQSYATGMIRQEKSDNEIQSEKKGEKYALSGSLEDLAWGTWFMQALVWESG